MWKYSRGACYIIYDPLVLPLWWPRVNNIRACVCFTICYFRQEGKPRKEKKREIFSYSLFFSRLYLPLTSSIGCSTPLHYALKIKTVGRERKPCAINSRGLTVSLFFHAIKSPSPPPPSALLLLLPSCAGGTFGRAGKKVSE